MTQLDELRRKVLTYEREMRNYEDKLEMRQKAMEVWQEQFGRTIKEVPVSVKEARIHRQLKEWNYSWESLPQDWQWEHEIRRLAAVLPVNPALACRELNFLTLNDNPLLNLIPPSSSNKPASAPTKEQLLSQQVTKLAAFKDAVKNPSRYMGSWKAPDYRQRPIKARFKSQDEFQRQVCVEREPFDCVAVFEFHCSHCGKIHDLPVTLAELIAAFTERAWQCTPHGSEHRGVFELVGVPAEVKALLP